MFDVVRDLSARACLQSGELTSPFGEPGTTSARPELDGSRPPMPT
jgi:hypothetical protein